MWRNDAVAAAVIAACSRLRLGAKQSPAAAAHCPHSPDAPSFSRRAHRVSMLPRILTVLFRRLRRSMPPVECWELVCVERVACLSTFLSPFVRSFAWVGWSVGPSVVVVVVELASSSPSYAR